MPTKHYTATLGNLEKVLLQAFDEVVAPKLVQFQKLVALHVYQRIIFRSPVDRGFFRNSHFISVDRRLLRTPTRPSSARQGQPATAGEIAHFQAGLSRLSELEPGHTIWITSNLPYSKVIEYGEYPNPPKKGSWIKSGRPGGPGYQILSSGGFSRQAPNGVYRVSVAEVLSQLQSGGLRNSKRGELLD